MREEEPKKEVQEEKKTIKEEPEKLNTNMDELNTMKSTSSSQSKMYKLEDIESGKLFACISYLSILALIPYFSESTNPYLKFHAKQGINLLVFEIIIAAGSIFFSLGILTAVFTLAEFILFALSVVGFINALTGNARELPIVKQIAIIK